MLLFHIKSNRPEMEEDTGPISNAFEKFGLLKKEDRDVYLPNDVILEQIGFGNYQVQSYESIRLENPIPLKPLRVCLFKEIRVYPDFVCTDIFRGVEKQPSGKIVPFQHYFGDTHGMFCAGYHNPGIIDDRTNIVFEELFGGVDMRFASSGQAAEFIESDKFHEFYIRAMQIVHDWMLPVIQQIDDRLARMHIAAPPNLPSLAELKKETDKLDWSNRRKNQWSVPNKRGIK